MDWTASAVASEVPVVGQSEARCADAVTPSDAAPSWSYGELDPDWFAVLLVRPILRPPVAKTQGWKLHDSLPA